MTAKQNEYLHRRLRRILWIALHLAAFLPVGAPPELHVEERSCDETPHENR